MKIGIDIDEVLADFITPFLKYYNSLFSTQYKKEDITDYDLWKVLSSSKEDMISIIYSFYNTDFFKQIKPVEGSVNGVHHLKENACKTADNGSIYAITSRQRGIIEKETIDYINKHFNGCFDEIRFTDKFVTKRKHLKKSLLCKALGIDFMIEDYQVYAEDCAKNKINVLLFDAPWNKKCKESNLIKRVYGWQEIIKIF